MKDLNTIASIMRSDWDRRIKHDFRFWMSDGYSSDEVMWHSGARDLDALMQGIPNTNSMSFLEIGCGVGRLLRAASSRFAKVTGLDISPVAIQKAKALLVDCTNIDLIVGNGLDLAPEVVTSSMDCVAIFAALCSAPTEVFARYLVDAHRVLKPQGYLRAQVYLGEEQQVGREDTLHLRCYQEENFRRAIEACGFTVEEIRPLAIETDIQIDSEGITAKLAFLRRADREPATADVVAKLLMPSGEHDGKSLDGDIEYWMSVNFAKSLVASGDVERAKKALEYAASVHKAASIDVGDLLERIVSEIDRRESGSYLQRNLEELAKRFPRVADILREATTKGVEISSTEDGPVAKFQGQILDHPSKPKSAGEAWVQRSIREKRYADCDSLSVVGFGFGYHIEALIAGTGKPVSVIEPTVEVFRAALEQRDLVGLISKLDKLCVGPLVGTDQFSETSELFIRPQSLIVHQEHLAGIKERFYGTRGLKALKPTVLVLGPMQGGTLPIMNYTTRALASLNQRTREVDMSAFAPGYHALNTMLKEPLRQQTMQANYLEFLAQGVLESVLEKKADIVICMAQAPVTGRVLNEMRARGIITVLWFVEDYLRFTYWKEMAKYYDFVFTIQRGECLDAIRQAGAGEVHYLAVGCDPIIHTPMQLSEEEKAQWGSPVSFVGAGYHNRQQIFATFAEMPFKLWGTEWPTCKPFDRMVQADGKRLTPEEYVKIFNATDININLHSSTERDGVDPYGDFINPRTFELASAGAFQLVDERSLLSEVFEPGKEIVTFKDGRDLKDKIAYYMDRPDERRAIAERGRSRVLREHTYAHRLRDMLSIIYSSKYEHLKNRLDTNPWRRLLERSKSHDELHGFCKRAFERGEEPILDGLIADIMVGQGKLTETEQKLLFLHHIRSQIIRMRSEEAGK